MDSSRLTIHSRPSSWGSTTEDCRSPSDSGSPSCCTLSTDPMSSTSGTIHFALNISDADILSPGSSTSSSLARLAWKPLDVNKDGSRSGNEIQHSKLPPLPKFPLKFPQEGPATMHVKVETRQITYSQSIKSEHPNIRDTRSPDSDVEPLPRTCYVPPTPVSKPRNNYPIGTAISVGSARQSEALHTDIIPGKTKPPVTLHTDIIPGKTVPPQLPSVESPAAEDFYHGSNSSTRASETTTQPTAHGSNAPTRASEISTQPTVFSTPHTVGTVNTTPSTQSTIQQESPGLRFGFSPKPAPTPRVASTLGSPPQPIHKRTPPQNITEEWHPPPQTPTRALSLSARPSMMPQVPPTVNKPQPSHSHSASNQSAQSHSRSDSTSSTTGLLPAPGRTRSFSGNKPSPFKLNPGNQVFPAPPGSSSDMQYRPPTSKFSDDGDGDDKDDGGDLAKKQWKVHFTIPLTLCLLFICGLSSAALHHIYYSQLHRTAPSDEFQQWHTRAGIAIAVFTTACWIGCVAICYKQRVWSTLVQKNMKISGIDALWGLVQNPSLFLVREAWKKSTVAMLLGVIMWILPLTTIFVPGALTIRPAIHGSSQGCMIPTFTPASADQTLLPAAEMDRLLQSQPSKDIPLISSRKDSILLTTAIKRIATVTAFSGKVPDFPLPAGCGNQGNCSYTSSFTAPGYKCDVVTSDEAKKKGPWGPVGFDALFSGSKGMTFYSVLPDNSTQARATQNTTSVGRTPFDLGFGSFWVASRFLGDEFTTADPSLLLDPSKGKKEMYTDEIFRCTDYVVAYDNVKFEYIDGHMDVQLSNAADNGIRYISPVDYNQFTDSNGSDLTESVIFSRVAHDFTLSILTGQMVVFNSALLSTPQTAGTDLLDKSRFFGSSDGKGIQQKFNLPKADLRSKIEELHRNVTLSFLSEPRLMGTYYTAATCQSTTNGLIYKYSALVLFLTYGIACFLTMVSIVVGIISLCANGFAADFSFSRILCTTRNPIIDGITRGESCLGTATERVGRQQLRFGEIWIKGAKKNQEKRGLGIVREEDDGDLERGDSLKYSVKVGHAAFGVPSEVMALRKGRGYA